jgi:hypothetical protein
MRGAARWSRRLVAALALLLAGCGSLVEPFEGAPQPAETAENGERVAVCYNKLFSTAAQVRSVAAEACGEHTTPQLVGQDLRLFCPLMTPVRATFLCVPE